MPKNFFNWKITGAAGEGVKSTGLMFSKVCLRSGLHTFDYSDYPSLIRGGHNTYQVHVSTEKVYSQIEPVDVLVDLNGNGVKFHSQEMAPESVIIVDQVQSKVDLSPFSDQPIINVPLLELTKDAGGEALMVNNTALGVSMFLLSLDMDILLQIIAETFQGKDTSITTLNQEVAQAGFKYASTNLKPLSSIHTPKVPQTDTISLSGNDALALGAIAGGMKAYMAYPMTPSSSILHALAAWQQEAKILVKHAEDEIGVINMALGTSFAGVRAAVGTSGGGFCYMTEAVGFSGVAELPLVIFESQRPGPALGMPTWTAQGDLLFVISASQDEFPRIVLAPGDVDEAFELSRLAFQLAEDYQIPVIVLADKHLSEGYQSTHFPTTVFSNTQTSINPQPTLDDNGFYPRYQPTESGVSLRSIPSQPNGFHLTNSYEADEYGLAAEDGPTRIAQMDKRFRKFDQIKTQIPPQVYQGVDNPQITFICWGSTKGAVHEGLKALQQQGIPAAMLHLNWLWPFPEDQVRQVIENSVNPVVIEGNKTSQLAQLIRGQTGIDIYHKRTRYDGRPFYSHQIVQFAKEILNLT